MGEAVAFAFWWNSPSRGRRHVDVRYDPFFEDDGSVSEILVDVRDTTEQTLTKEELERSVVALEVANRDLEAFGDSLAHDLKTPLLTVTNFSYYLNESIGNSLDEQQADHLQRIQGAGQQMIQIIDDLRDLADVDRVEIRPDEVDLTSLAQGIIGDMRALAPDRKVGLEAEPDIMALGDGTLLRLLLTNLFQNAWKYTGKSDDAHIELGVVEDEGGVPVYYVRDNGIGFDNVHREKIFRAFERLDTVGDISGSGLGLATVERIVHRHGGRAWAEGTPGEGAVFYFTLASSSSDMASLILDRRSQVR
jgi:signal transduction histidine kinase